MDTTSPGALSTSIDPVVVAMPPSAEVSIPAVAVYIATREPERRHRIKALHDWVADRVTYDSTAARALETENTTQMHPFPSTGPGVGSWWSSAADRAFAERQAVCAGYAALLHTLGAAIGEDIPILVGEGDSSAESSNGATTMGPHAWNLAQTGHGYEPIDVTWDAGCSESRCSKPYQARWLFTPAEKFAASHRVEENLSFDPGIRQWDARLRQQAGDPTEWTKDSRFAFPFQPWR